MGGRFRCVFLWVAVGMLAGSALGAEPVSLAGSYVWHRGEETQEGDLDVSFAPSGDGRWDVTFRFDWEGEAHVFEGSAWGSLEGKLTGRVDSDDPGHPLKFRFEGKFKRGKFRGTHGYYNGVGDLVDSGTLEMWPSEPT